MPDAYVQVYNALGGGIAGLLGVALIVIFTFYVKACNARIQDLKDANKELRDDRKQQDEIIRDLSTVVRSWTPSEQLEQRALRPPRQR